MNCYVICRDRLTPLKELVKWLQTCTEINIILVDNASSYPPLLQWYKSLEGTKIVVWRNTKNYGSKALWDPVAGFYIEGSYIVCDCDIGPTEETGSLKDMVYDCVSILAEFPHLTKVGPSLKIDDLPDHYKFKNDVILWESQFWEKELVTDYDSMGTRGYAIYDAPLSTTFAVHRAGSGYHGPSARLGPPYIIKHQPWYLDSNNLSEEELYYTAHLEHLGEAGESNWNELGDIPASLRSKIDKLK